MGRLYIDLTMLAHWQGNLTGIPRVMYEHAMRHVDNKNTTFIIWGEDQAQYFEVKKAETLRDHGKQLHYVRPAGQEVQTSTEKGFHFATRAINKLERSGLDIVPGGIKKKVADQAVAAVTPTLEKDDVLYMPWGAQGPDNHIEFLQDAAGRGVKISQFFHDLLPVSSPQFSGHSKETMEKYIRHTFEITDVIIANSQSTKNDLAAWMEGEGLKVPKTEVVRLGDELKDQKPEQPGDKRFDKNGLKTGEYMICVGTIEARKNHMLLYYVQKLAKSKGIKIPPTVIVGREGWHTENVLDLMRNDPEVKDQLVVLTDINDAELAWLYEHARFGIQPSFYEGWGIPVATCIFYGKPCIASNKSSIPEIAGDMIDYFDPSSTDECLKAIRKLLDDDALKDATKRIKKYTVTTWDDTTKQIDDEFKGLHTS